MRSTSRDKWCRSNEPHDKSGAGTISPGWRSLSSANPVMRLEPDEKLPPTPPAPPGRKRTIILSFLGGALTVLVLLAIAAFGIYWFGATGRMAERQTRTASQLSADYADAVKEEADSNRRDVARIVKQMYECQQRDPNCTLDYLLLSGGGDYGAFGSGFLVGWASIPPGPDALPTFDGVSGVSTGAFIAPFAFLGTQADYETIDRLFRNPKPDWYERRGPLFFLPDNASLAEVPGLVRDLRSQVTLQFAKRIVDAATGERVLLIQATDLDSGTPLGFDLVAAAREAVASGDANRVSNILLASAAIPGAFPPLEIHDNLYVDGGVSSNFYYGGPDAENVTFGGTWRRQYPNAPVPKTRYWIIINEYVRPDPATVQPTWPSIVARSLYVSIRSAEWIALHHLYAMAEATRLRGEGDVEVRWVAVPQDWKPASDNHFEPETMRSLSDEGRRLGADPKSWHTRAP